MVCYLGKRQHVAWNLEALAPSVEACLFMEESWGDVTPEPFPRAVRWSRPSLRPTFLLMSIRALSSCTTVRTALHRDSHNCRSSLNLVVGLSKFEGGAIWVADDGGDVTEEIDGKPLKGRDLEVQRGPVAFQPRRWHFTRAWSGDRTVLVLYSVRDCIKACSGGLRFLAGLGFHLPAKCLHQVSDL